MIELLGKNLTELQAVITEAKVSSFQSQANNGLHI